MKSNLEQKHPEISIILPCRNEESALGACLEEIKQVIAEYQLSAEIIVSDSSIDNSPQIAKDHKVILVKHDKVGYGRAYLEAFKEARGKYLFMADADGSYSFSEIPRFIEELRGGYDLVIGNRFAGNIKTKAMPSLHRHLGNPLLSGLVRIFYGRKVKDVHCGLRAIKKEALESLKLKTTGMEFASEMIIKAMKNDLKIKEFPIDYNRRQGQSKLRSFRDGWRHLRFILLYSPLLLFFIPGGLLFFLGFSTLLWFYFGQPVILGLELYFHPMFASSVLTIVGYQIIIFAAFAKIYAITHLSEKNELMEKLFQYITIEKVGLIGFLLSSIGALIYLIIFYRWVSHGFGDLDEIKNAIIGLTLLIIGIQTIFSGFMISILGIKEK